MYKYASMEVLTWFCNIMTTWLCQYEGNLNRSNLTGGDSARTCWATNVDDIILWNRDETETISSEKYATLLVQLLLLFFFLIGQYLQSYSRLGKTELLEIVEALRFTGQLPIPSPSISIKAMNMHVTERERESLQRSQATPTRGRQTVHIVNTPLYRQTQQNRD